jgi:hypothetical protein
MAKIKLGAITDGKDKNRYCGPSVISALTDLTTGEAARLIRKQNGRSTIRGSYTHEVLDALRACNIKSTRWEKPGVRLSRTTGPTLAGWLRLSKEDRTPGRVFLISAGHHWQLVSGRRYTCSRIREIVSIKDKRVKRRARVSEVYELTSDKVTKPDIDVSKPKDRNAGVRARAHRVAKEIGVEIITHRSDDPQWPANSYEIMASGGPDLDDEADPCGERFNLKSWREVLEMVQDYKEVVEKRRILQDYKEAVEALGIVVEQRT